MVRSIEQEIRDLHELFGSSRDPEGLAFVPLADAYRRSGDTTRALVLLTDGRARHPDLPAASLVEGLVRRDLGDAEGAEEAFRRVLELDPDNARALVALGRVLTGRRSSDPEGEALLRRGLALDPGLVGEAEPPEPAAGHPEPEATPSAGVDDGLVAPEELTPAGSDGGGAVLEEAVEAEAEGEIPEEAADPEVEAEAADGPDEADAVAADAGWEAGIELEMPDPSEGEAWPTEELHIQWDAEAAFEPFDGGLYGGSDVFDGHPASREPEEAAAVEGGVDSSADPEAFETEVVPEVGSLPTGDVAPEELLMELSDLAPDLEPGLPPIDDDDDEEDVLPTRTLAELYVRQGLLGEAVQVYQDLVDRSPDDWGLQARLEEVRAQMARGRGPVGGAVQAPTGPSVREFLTGLLAWRPEDGSPGSDVG